MSAEEGPELRELIAQTLENNGVLAKIRAQLRASVFLAIEDQDAFQTKLPFTNQPLRTFLKTFEGAFVTCLVREFLEFFNLDFTLSVFDPETFYGKEYSYGGRTELLKDLKLQNNERNAPVLSYLLQNVLKVRNKTTENDITSKKSDVLSAPTQDASMVDSAPETSKILDVSLNEDSISIQIKNRHKSQEKYGPTEETISTASKRDDSSKISKGSVSHTVSASQKQPAAAVGKGDIDDGIHLQHGSQLTSLSNLPPLAGMLKSDGRSIEVQMPKSSEGNIGIKPLINLGNETADNYEEDFQSSVSGSGQGGKSGKLTTPGSDTEIEEDIGVDDLLSNASMTEELTVDVTASNMSGVGDYMENIS